MKLVEILARELSTWPEGDRGNDGITQDGTGELNTLDSDCDPSFHHGGQAWEGSSHSFLGKTVEVADDYDTAVVGIAQWQAERDRQKGSEWKRHRGGKQPVDNAVYVEVKLRCGDVQQSHAQDFLWYHSECDHAANIMQYRVIIQPQAEEVVPMSNPVKSFDPYEVDDTDHGPVNVQFIEAKTDQIDGPIKWRDTIIELEAHEEDIQREIAILHARLTSEGFQLIRQYPSVKHPELTVDMSDYRNWVHGDILKCVSTRNTCAELTVGREYKAVLEGKDLGVEDDAGDHMCYCIENGNMVFVRRP